MSKFADLQLTVDTVSRLFLKHPDTGKPLVDNQGNPAFVDLLSAESQVAIDFDRAAIDAKLAKVGQDRATSDSIANDIATKLATLTRNWHLVSTKTGEPIDIPFSYNDALDLYAKPSWLRGQVDMFLSNRINFSAGSSKN